jgi:uncharacterized protein
MTWVLVFLGGVAGSLHCVGMCGGFPLALAAATRHDRVRRQLLYNLGRVNALVFIGALSGAAGAALVAAGPVRVVERALAIVAGLFMIAVGAEMLGWLSRVSSAGAALARATVGRLLGGVLRSRSAAAPLALGIFNAFLPCQLVYAFAARAASTASVGEGMLTMLVFGAGTVPAMLALGVGGAPLLARPTLRARLSLASAILVILFGLLTLLRGTSLAPHAGHHIMPMARVRPAVTIHLTKAITTLAPRTSVGRKLSFHHSAAAVSGRMAA